MIKVKSKTAKLAQKKGFEFQNKASENDYQGEYPTQSELQKWLRDVHKIFVEPTLQTYPSNHIVRISRQSDEGRNLRFRDDTTNMGYISYELALERGLFEALKLI